MKYSQRRWIVKTAVRAALSLALLLLFVFSAGASGKEEPAPAPQPAAQPAKQLAPVNIKLGAMPIGSSWYVYAATYSKLFQDALPAGSAVEVIPQGGGTANPLAVSQGKAEVAISNVATARWAYDGVMEYEGRAAKNIRALAGGLNQVFAVAVFSQEYIDRTGIDSIEKLAEKKAAVRFITKPEGSLAPTSARLILEANGMSFDKIKEWGGSVTQVSGGQIPALMRDGRADLWMDMVPPNHPALTEGMLTSKLKIVSLGEETLKKLAKLGLYADTIATDAFPNMDRPVRTVNPGTVIIAIDTLPEEVAYLITKTICEKKDEVVAADRSIAFFKPELAWKEENTAIPLHPGAIRYYKERGWMK
jgi:TRAP transporter TAXI family solute receptor